MVEKNKTNKKEKHSYEFEPVNLGTIFIGIFAVMVGFYFLAKNLDLIPEQFYISVWQLWPLIIIFIGLSFLKVRSMLSAVIGVIAIVLLIGLIGAFVVWSRYSTTYNAVETPINVEPKEEVERGKLEVDFGAGDIRMDGSTDSFVQGRLRSNVLTLKEESELNGSVQEVKLDFDSRRRIFTGRPENDLELSLNDNLPMDIYLKSGASNVNMDLTEVQAEMVDIDTGASDLNLIMGDKAINSQLKIDAGASSLNLSVPQTVGVDLNIDSGVSSQRIEDFEKIGDDQYRSRNYPDVSKFINIELDLGVSDVEIEWR